MNAAPVLAVVGACGVLFGASYAAAELTDQDDGVQAQPRPAVQPVDTPAGRALALEGVERLPDLGRPPKPKPKPKPDPAPAPQVTSAPAAPASPAPAPSDPPEAEQPVSDPPPQNGPSFESPPEQPSQPQPSAPTPQPAAPPTDFYDSDG